MSNRIGPDAKKPPLEEELAHAGSDGTETLNGAGTPAAGGDQELAGYGGESAQLNE
jgi:hypothetical protein